MSYSYLTLKPVIISLKFLHLNHKSPKNQYLTTVLIYVANFFHQYKQVHEEVLYIFNQAIQLINAT